MLKRQKPVSSHLQSAVDALVFMAIAQQQGPLALDLMPAGKVVLVADDSDDDFLLLQRAFRLAKFRHELVRVRNGDAAITYLKGDSPFDDRQRWPFPDLVLLDEKMPDGSGFDVLRFLREHQMEHPQLRVPAVLLSGSAAPRDVYQALELGAAEYISKPSGMSELVVMVQTIHHRWLASGSAKRAVAY